MANFEKMKKDELIALAQDLECRVKELEAAPVSDGQGNGAVAGLINIGSLWGTDPQGEKYKNKNDERMYIGALNGRIMLTMNRFKQAGSRQPDLRLVLMPFRPQQQGADGESLFDELSGQSEDKPEHAPF
ncbi:MAG: hypothetical protein MIO92_02710 [Methanosarcinaceae archaeon]|nr:hypothetical protein [Methanosarcinaceae archaeon]